MKQFYTLLTAILISFNLFSQAPGWQWAIGAGGAGSDEAGNGIATDGSGNIYSLGSFGCNTLVIGTQSVVRAGGGNPYVVKQDPAGNVLWLKSYAFSPPTFFGIGAGKSIFADASGNTYIAGYYYTSIVIGTTTLLATDSSSSNAGDVFVAKLDPSGNAVWAKSVGGAYADMVNSITADANGNVYITGTYRSRYMRFGTSITLFNPNNSSATFFNNTDIYFAKFDPNGNPVWAKNTGHAGGGFNEGKGICIDAAGNVLVAGTFYTPSVTFGSVTLTGAAAVNLFVTKYDNAGNVIWAKTAVPAGSGSINHTSTGITSDGSNNVYITGANGASTLTLGSIVLANKKGAYVAKLDPSGNYQWVESITGNAYGTGIAHKAGDIFVTGYFDGMSCTAGTATIANTNTGGNNEDIFVAKYNTAGTFSWATGAGGNFRDISNGISVDNSGNANITGYTTNTSLSFGTLSVTCTGSYNDIFIAKMGNMSGIEELNKNVIVNVYPNPGNGQFKIETDATVERVEITNVLGETIYSTNDLSSHQTIDISDKPKGIYFVRLRNSSNVVGTGKLIIE